MDVNLRDGLKNTYLKKKKKKEYLSTKKKGLRNTNHQRNYPLLPTEGSGYVQHPIKKPQKHLHLWPLKEQIPKKNFSTPK